MLNSLGLNANKLPANPPAKARRALDALLRDTPPHQRRAVRQAHSVPVLNTLPAWLDHTQAKTLPSGKLGKTMGYLRHPWEARVRFCDDGRYNIDTHPADNAIRAFCLARKNGLLCDTVAGDHASARLYSLIECAKANGTEPYA